MEQVKMGSLVEIQVGGRLRLALVLTLPNEVDGKTKVLLDTGVSTGWMPVEVIQRQVAFTLLLSKWAYVKFRGRVMASLNSEPYGESVRYMEANFQTSKHLYWDQGGMMPDISPYDDSLPLQSKAWVLCRVVSDKTGDVDYLLGQLTGKESHPHEGTEYQVVEWGTGDRRSVRKKQIISVFAASAFIASYLSDYPVVGV